MASHPRTPPGQCATSIPGIVDPREGAPAAARGLDWLSVAALGTWAACGLWPLTAMVEGRFTGWPAALYFAAFIVYGVALIAILILPQRMPNIRLAVPLSLALIETITGLAMNLLTISYLQGTGVGIGLLVIVAAQLPYFLATRWTSTWIAAQTLFMTSFFIREDPTEAITFALAIGGFQIFAAASSILALNEGRARTKLARTNAELQATRGLLAESSRTAERLRISRDLHDTLGHHLAALSLQLDVASRLSEGAAAEHIQQAHAITKLLLSDVRSVVSTLRETSRLDLSEAIRALAVQPIAARIHLDLPDSLTIEDAGRAEAILRAIQEIITNTARHASARNLWIAIDARADGIHLHARDDGRGASSLSWGNGLKGMRERFEEFSGTIDVKPGSPSGFEVHAFMPTPSAA